MLQVSQDQLQQVVQTQKIAPHLIQASEILQCSTQELVQAIELELMENPALESADASPDTCADCSLPYALCTTCPRKLVDDGSFSSLRTNTDEPTVTQPSEQSELPSVSFQESDYVEYVAGPDGDDSFDPITLKPSGTSLRDHLLTGLRSMTSDPATLHACEYLVNSLDNRGWLKLDEAEAMELHGIDQNLLLAALDLLQSCEPAGIGARSLQECLLLQLRQHADDNRGNELAMSLVQDHWESLAQRRYEQSARRLRCPIEDVLEAVKYIQNELTPDPAGSFRQPWEYKPDTRSDAVRPDVVIRRTTTGFEVEVQSHNHPPLNVSTRYRRLYEMIKSGGRSAPGIIAKQNGRLSPQERKHIVQYVDRADLFLKNLQQRQKTIERITRCLIEAQQGFVETGSRTFLLPLTRTELARRTNLHESTVSRALLHKYVQMPSQEVLSFEAFFVAAGSVKETIASLISEESPDHPLSDETLRHELEERGVQIARRTIVKYRESMRIPASYLRRRR